MINLTVLAGVVIVILLGGTFTYMAWDQIAMSMHWPRPTWGAGVGLVFLGVLANFMNTNRLGWRMHDSNDETGGEEEPEGGAGGGTEVRKDPPSDITPVG